MEYSAEDKAANVIILTRLFSEVRKELWDRTVDNIDNMIADMNLSVHDNILQKRRWIYCELISQYEDVAQVEMPEPSLDLPINKIPRQTLNKIIGEDNQLFLMIDVIMSYHLMKNEEGELSLVFPTTEELHKMGFNKAQRIVRKDRIYIQFLQENRDV